jgi:hypothetical protein
MIAIVLIVLAVAVVTHLVSVVRTDRPLSPPRSHAHETDPRSAGMLRG